ncbi:FecR family protein [Phenylobacterium sp.]|uniref:FecR family protein n=1 Tax=Phenylobacterium sp. TaxID=1871053 RepID=UPI003784BFB6
MTAQEETALAEAAGWLARLQGPEVSEHDGLAFDAWLAIPGHRAAYRRTLSVWHDAAAGAAQVLAEMDAEAGRAARRKPAGVSRRWMVGAGGFAVAAGLAVAVLPAYLEKPSVATYETPRGETQRVVLEDGSTIDINAETRLSVSYGRGARAVTITEGEAIFDVAHDAGRPFTVAAAGRTVRVLGTQFNVRSRSGTLSVVVARGKVEVRPQDAAAGKAYVLVPGQRLSFDRSGVGALRTVDPQEALSWRLGRLVYRDEPLAEVVADLNRQFQPQIELADPELAAMPVTGVIVLDDPQAIAGRLSLMLPVRSVPSERGLLLHRK